MTAANVTKKPATLTETIRQHEDVVGKILVEGKGQLTASEARALRKVETQLALILEQEKIGFRPDGGDVQKLGRKDRKALTALQGKIAKNLAEIPATSKTTGIVVTLLGLGGLGAIAAKRTDAVTRFVAFATPHALKAQEVITAAYSTAKEAVSARADRVAEIVRPRITAVTSFVSEKTGPVVEKATRSFQFVSGKVAQATETLKALPLSHKVGLGVGAIATVATVVLGVKGTKVLLQKRRHNAAVKEVENAEKDLKALGFFARKGVAKARLEAAKAAEVATR